MRKTLRQGIALWLVVTCTLPFVLAHPARSRGRRRHPTPEPVAASTNPVETSPSGELRDTETTYRFRRLRRYRRAERVEEVVEVMCARIFGPLTTFEFELAESPEGLVDCSDGPWVSLAPPLVSLRC
jgi:hypothetical protein